MAVQPDGRLKAILFGLGALAALLAVLLLRGAPAPADKAPSASEADPAQTSTPAPGLAFEPAPGDGADRPRFIARGNGYVARLDPAGAQFRLYGASGRDGAGGPAFAHAAFRLAGANAAAAGAGLDPLPGRSHYYLGDDPGAWRVNVPNYARVGYAAVYPGIDMVYHGEQGGLEFDFIVTPGADPDVIRLAFDAGRDVRIDAAGDLLLATAAGDLRLRRPVAYQEVSGRRERVDAAFELDGAARELRFRVGSYDASRRLIIDPVITYADYLGGAGADSAQAIAVDAGGNRYVTGSTGSALFADEDKPLGSGTDAYVAKLDPSGARLYVTFVGGVGADESNAIAVDSGGEAFIAGRTASPALPATGGTAQPSYGGNGDAFIARLATDGALEYSSYLGGAALDIGRAIALSAGGDVVVGGSTLSGDFPLQDARQPALAGQSDGFVTRISPDGTALVYSTYHGGIGPDNVAALALDETDAVYVGGTTDSDDFPTTLGSYRDSFQGGGSDGYVTKFDPDGAALVYSTYLGGSGTDGVLALAVDGDHYAYLTGFTSSDFNYPVTPNTPTYGGGTFDAFVTRLIPNGSVPDYSSFLGGDGEDQGLAIALSDVDQVVVAGVTGSDDLPLTQPFQVERLGGADGFVVQVQFSTDDDTPVSQLFSSYLGGTGDESITAIQAESALRFHLAGAGVSANLPVVLPTQGVNAGGTDAFVMRLDRDPALALPDLAVSVEADPTPVSRRNTLEFTVRVDNSGIGAASGVLLRVDGSNFSALSSPNASCEAGAGISLLCAGGGINGNGFGSFEIRAVPDEIGPVTLTATLLRADQSGISAGDNAFTLERLVVDDSDQSAAMTWELLVLIAGMPLLCNRRVRRRRAGA
ncbi:MAG: SBBP repeat-containing protein [Gammaproteobacteria bacterium]